MDRQPRPGKRLIKDFQEEAFARQRIGDTAERRLRWVVEFVQRDLNRLRLGERVALGYDLRALIPRGWQITRSFGPMPDSDLRKFQAQIREGIRKLVEKPSFLWPLPSSRSAYLSRVREAGARRHRIQLTWEGTEAEGVIGGVVDLLLQEGERLRACAECGKPIVARKRQEYCSPGCSQRTRTRRKLEKARKGGR